MQEQRGYKRALFAFMVVLLLMLVILDSLIVLWEKRTLVSNAHRQAYNELKIIGAFVTEPLLSQEFTIVEQFMIHWGELEDDVVGLKAFTPAGYLLAEYGGRFTPEESIVKQYKVVFTGKHLLTLEITKDIEPINLHLKDFRWRLAVNSFFVMLIIGFLLWLVLKHLAITPLEKEIHKRKMVEADLHLAHDGLENLIEQRTEELRKANIELHNEIYEKTKMQEELLKAKKLESIGVLAGGIAHDFNNILTAITGNINLATLYTKPDDKRFRLLQSAEKAAVRASDLTQQLLTFSKGGEPVKKLASIEEVVRDSASFVLRGSKIRCNFHFEEDLWPLEIDAGQISQVIQNIIINASHAMPDGGSIEVNCRNHSCTRDEIKLLETESCIKIEITDHGIGIPPEMIDKIFDPYFSTKKEGSGLGLAICHSIINNHGGAIRVESDQGKGSRFIIMLPAQKNARLQQDAGEESVRFEFSGKALVMDDEEMVRELAREMLSYLGFDTILAEDGEEAIALYRREMAQNDPFDFVILDLTVPGGMGGRKTVRKILEDDPAAKVIVASGYSNDPVMAKYDQYGFAGMITKPFQLKNLRETIQKVLSAEK